MITVCAHNWSRKSLCVKNWPPFECVWTFIDQGRFHWSSNLKIPQAFEDVYEAKIKFKPASEFKIVLYMRRCQSASLSMNSLGLTFFIPFLGEEKAANIMVLEEMHLLQEETNRLNNVNREEDTKQKIAETPGHTLNWTLSVWSRSWTAADSVRPKMSRQPSAKRWEGNSFRHRISHNLTSATMMNLCQEQQSLTFISSDVQSASIGFFFISLLYFQDDKAHLKTFNFPQTMTTHFIIWSVLYVD